MNQILLSLWEFWGECEIELELYILYVVITAYLKKIMLNYVMKVAKQGVANHSTVGGIVGGKLKKKPQN